MRDGASSPALGVIRVCYPMDGEGWSQLSVCRRRELRGGAHPSLASEEQGQLSTALEFQRMA